MTNRKKADWKKTAQRNAHGKLLWGSLEPNPLPRRSTRSKAAVTRLRRKASR